MKETQPAQTAAPFTVIIAPVWPVVAPRVVHMPECGEPAFAPRPERRLWGTAKKGEHSTKKMQQIEPADGNIEL